MNVSIEAGNSTAPAPVLAACELRMHVGDQREMLFPAHVAHGDGMLGEIGTLVNRWGVAAGDALVVTDRMLAGTTMLDPVLAGLQEGGWRTTVHADIGGEPTVADARAAAEAARRSGADVIIGVGGGSVLDIAKVAAFLAANPGDIADYFGGAGQPRAARPLVLVPTTTGTGAEATRVAVFSDDHGKRVVSHDSLVPLGVVLDATAVVGLPPAVTAATGMDALAHATESTLSTASTPLTASMGIRAAELLHHWLPIAYDDPGDLRARRGTLYGAFLAGVALNAGVVLGHSMAYTVANRVHLAHGVTCAMALPYCLAYNKGGAGSDFGAFAHLFTGGTNGHVLAGAESLASLAERFDLPATPAAAGIAHEHADGMAEECATVYPRPTNPVPMTSDGLRALYRAWFAGDLHGAAEAGAAA
jgi:alcohol dehydrogenase class IV